MKILAMEKEIPGLTSEEFSTFAKAEARQVWRLIQEDKIREIYFRGDQESAVILLECQDTSEAKQILGSLPFVINSLIEFEIYPLRPYPGLDRLIKD